MYTLMKCSVLCSPLLLPLSQPLVLPSNSTNTSNGNPTTVGNTNSTTTTITGNTTHNNEDKRGVKRILQQLKEEAEIDKAALNLKYEKTGIWKNTCLFNNHTILF
ncbi:unnamed protein product [Mucor hiemalis]